MKKEINLQIPQTADRCVVLIAHPTAVKGELSDDDRTVAAQTKDGNSELIGTLAERFGRPTVHCGQSNVSIMTAVAAGHTKITPLRTLDTPNSHRQARKRARRILFDTSYKQPLVIAYGDLGIVNKALGARNVASKTGTKPAAEAVIMFINKHGQVINAHKQDLTLAA